MRKQGTAKAAPKVQQTPVGIIGLRTSSGLVEEEFLRDLQWPNAGKVYQEMASNDAVVGGCLYLIETMVRKAKWRVVPASQDASDVEAAAFLESCMHDMSGQTWDDFVCEVLSMLPYGFSFHEILYKVRRGPLEKDLKFRSQHTDGRIGWQALPIRSQASFSEWVVDAATGRPTHFKQDPSLVGQQAQTVDIPIDGNLLFKTKAARGNPEGWSILRRAYRSWYFRKYIEELEGIGIERNLAGIPVLQPDEDTPLFDSNNKDMARLLSWSQELVNNLRQDRNHGVVLPANWTLKLMSVDGSGKLDTDTIIRRHENRIAISLLSDVLLMGGDRTGSFALAETKQGLLVASLQTIINTIAATLNSEAVATLFALNNWTLERLPKIVADDLIPTTISEVALLLRSLKVDISKDQKLFNFVLSLIQAPELTTEEYSAFIAAQPKESDNSNNAGNDEDDIQDGAENELKQSEERYT